MRIAGMLVCVFIFTASYIEAQNHQSQQLTSVEVVEEDSASLSIEEKADSIFISTTSNSFTAPSYLFKPSPRKAVMYSAIFPGLGQIYNRQYFMVVL